MNKFTKLKVHSSQNVNDPGRTGINFVYCGTLFLETASLPEEIILVIAEFESDDYWMIDEMGTAGITVSIRVNGENDPRRGANLFLPHGCIKGIKSGCG